MSRVIDALGHERVSTYDSSSNVIDRTGAAGNKAESTFDADNNLSSSKLPTGATTRLDYSDAAHKYSPTKVTNAQTNTWTMAYDTAGNLASVTDSMPTPGRSQATYNPNGTLSSLGDAPQADSSAPRRLTGMSDVTDLAAGSLHALVERSDGSVWAWGDNTNGQLGDGTAGGTRAALVQVLNLQSPLGLGAGGQHSVAVDGGATWGWGSNAEYQLGNNSNESSSRPVQVLQSNPDQALASVVTIAARGDYSVAMLIDGSVREWGVHSDDVACIVADPKVTIKPGFKPKFLSRAGQDPAPVEPDRLPGLRHR